MNVRSYKISWNVRPRPAAPARGRHFGRPDRRWRPRRSRRTATDADASPRRRRNSNARTAPVRAPAHRAARRTRAERRAEALRRAGLAPLTATTATRSAQSAPTHVAQQPRPAKRDDLDGSARTGLTRRDRMKTSPSRLKRDWGTFSSFRPAQPSPRRAPLCACRQNARACRWAGAAQQMSPQAANLYYLSARAFWL
jgi:hypothetical protein